MGKSGQGLGHRLDSAYDFRTTLEERTPEAVALMKSLVNNAHAVEDTALVRLLMADRVLMGSTNMAHSPDRAAACLRHIELRRWKAINRPSRVERMCHRAIWWRGACSPMTAP